MSKLQLNRSIWVRRVFVSLGFMSLLAGFMGVFLPILPTVPFLLLAAFCFARGSARFHQWLLDHHLTGPLIRDWYQHQSIRSSTRRRAALLIVLSFSLSILLVPSLWLRLLLAVAGVMLLIALWRLPVRDVRPEPGAADS
jgi:uncharacterized membrane protein YbaN (DUF454 family)